MFNFMPKCCSTICSLTLSVMVGLAPFTSVHAQRSSPVFEISCLPTQYGLAYFNGIREAPRVARNSAKRLRDLVGPNDAAGNLIQARSFYNTTNGTLRDTAEVFIQKAEELDPDVSESFWQLFWFQIDTDNSNYQELLGQIAASQVIAAVNVRNFIADLFTESATTATSTISELIADEPLPEYAMHQQYLDTWKSENRNPLLVAHSQGNLFVVPAYDTALSRGVFTSDEMRVVHIAPPLAEESLRGDYILSHTDIVINSLRAPLGSDAIADNTVTVLNSAVHDILGHSLFDIYLNPATAANIPTRAALTSSLLSLQQTSDPAIAFELEMTWPATSGTNLDMWVSEPGLNTVANSVFFPINQGVQGVLEPDLPLGPEVYKAECDFDLLLGSPGSTQGSYIIRHANEKNGTQNTPFEIAFKIGGNEVYRVTGVANLGRLATNSQVAVFTAAGFPGRLFFQVFE